MFVESLLESSLQRSRRPWATLLSFALQSAVLAFLVLLPLFYTQALPNLMARIVTLPTPPGPGAPDKVRSQHAAASQSEVVDDTVRQSVHIPMHTPMVQDSEAPEPGPSLGDVVPGGIGNGGDWGSSPLARVLPAPQPVPPTLPPPRVAVSCGVSQGYLIYQFKPSYPALARTAHVQGQVVLAAVISRTGRIQNLQVLSGHPLLVPAAIDAVRQWRYRPYLLNGTPVEVETQITIYFTLAGGGS